MLFICDESGNSGSNFCDENQPFFVIGGLLVEDDNVCKLNKIIDNAKIKHKRKEIHCQKLFKSASGRKIILNLLKEILKIATPVTVVCEKRYAISAKVVETLLDQEYNKKAPLFITGKHLSDELRDYAEVFYKLPTKLLNNFYQAYKEYDNKNMLSVIEEISLELNKLGYSELSEIVDSSKNHIDLNLFDEENAIDDKSLKSLNIPMFVVLYTMIKDLGNSLECQIGFIHDHIPEFSSGYEQYLNIDNSLELVNIKEYGNGNKFIIGNNIISSFEFNDSETNNVIQAADILVTSLNKMITLMLKDDDKILNDSYNREIATLLLPNIACLDNPKLMHYMVSESFHKNVAMKYIHALDLVPLMKEIYRRCQF